MQRSAIIIGAGVVGVCSAYALAKRGWQVTLLDSEEGPALGTSHANGAQLSYSYTEALGSPATLAAMPRLLLRDEGVSFNLSLRPAYLLWLAEFLRNCTDARFRRNTLDVFHLAQQSRAAMDAFCTQHELDFAHRVAGKIHLLYSDRDINRAQKVRALKAEAGCEQHILRREELTQLDPALAGLDRDVIAAISTPSEVVGDAFQFCAGLTAILIRDYGVETQFGATVTSLIQRKDRAEITLEGGEILGADLAVVACGTGSNSLLAPLGLAERIEPMKGYSFEVPLISTSPSISVTDGKRRIVFTNLGDRMRIAGIAQLGNANREIDQSRIEQMIESARACMPEGGDYEAAGQFWSGIRPATPHSQPIIRRASKHIAVNAGHGALGWTLAMGSGERLASMLD
ncbi:MAG: FAD-dependent oxidoreductase [Pseudomonadota bacterium]